MNYEEKYKDALERAKKEWLNNLDNAYKNYRERLEIIFPELKKSEDEKIREDLMEWFKEFPDMIWRNHYKTDVLEWFEKQREKDKLIEELLEKQGEQKPYGQRKKCFDCQFNYAGECKGSCQMKRDEQNLVDRVEPKFKVGDKVYALSNRFECTIESIDETTYYGDTTNFDIKDQDNWELVEQKPYGQRKKCFDCQFNCVGECKGSCQMKRDEQIHADKIEPKFKVGDWIVSKYMHLVMQILNNNNGFYETVETDGTERNDSYDFIERNFKLWSITDAKDGDVLCYETKNEIRIFIYKNGHIHYHCCYCNAHLTTVDSFFVVEKYLLCYIHQQQKEQRNLLFAKIKEKGYEWDDKKKELKKIEHKKDINNKLTDFEYSLKHIMEEAIECGDTHNLKADADMLIRLAQKPTAWSKEDERIYQSIIDDTVQENQLDIKQIDWLKSLKGRVQPQSKQEWSEEDNKRIERIYDFLWKHKRGFSAIIWQIEEDANWLKSLKPHNTWKPSEEQMDALETAVSSLQSNTLESLYQDLKREKL